MTTPTEPTVKVTMRDVYDLLLDLKATVDKMDGQPAQLQDHETRIRSLERKVWIAAGTATAAGGLLGSIGQQLF